MIHCDTITNNNITVASNIAAALYARVSSQQQLKDGTIASQVEAIRQRIAADGLLIDDSMHFVDDGYSGSTLVRPALERLRDAADSGAIARLYVLSPDRLSRQYAYQVVLVDELRRCGVEIVFLNHDLGRTPEGDMLLQVQGIVAQYERAQIMERSRRGRLHAAKRGSVSVLTQAPYGYRYIPRYHSGQDAILNVVFEHATVVRQIFTWIGVERVSIREVCRRLEKQGILSPKGKKHWGRGSVFNMLRNPVYMGQAAYGKTRAGEMRKRPRPYRHADAQPRWPRGIYRTPSEEWIRFAVPAIVEPELFEAVAEQMKENRKRQRSRAAGPRDLLAGLTVCKKCSYSFCAAGGSSKGNQKPHYRYYRCIGRDAYRNGGQSVCDARSVRSDQLEAVVWKDVCDLLNDPTRLAEEYQRRLRGGDQPSVTQEKQKLLDARNRTQRAIARLIDAWSEGLLQKDEFEPKIRASRAALEQLNAQIQSQRDQENAQAEMRLIIGSVETFAQKVGHNLAQADFAAKRDIIRALVNRIEVDQDNVRIVYRVNPNSANPNQTAAKPLLQHCQSDA
jgi:site-specific DNA recombinase